MIQQYTNLVRRGFLLVHMWKYATKQVLLVSKSGKNLEARLHSIRALNPRPEGNLQIYQKLTKKDLQIQSF